MVTHQRSDVQSLERWWDLILVAIVSASAVGIIGASPDSLLFRLLFGLPLVLFLPGYAVVSALFPRHHELDGAARLALAFGLSIAIAPLVAYLVSFTPLQIRPLPVALGLLSVTWFALGAAIIRRSPLADAETFMWRVAVPGSWTAGPPFAPFALFGAYLLLVFSLAAALGASGRADPYTSFYAVGVSGRVADIPREVFVGEEFVVRLGIENHEGSPKTYRVRAQTSTSPQPSEQTIDVASGASVTTELRVPMIEAGIGQKVEVLLFDGDSLQPHRALQFFLDVKPR